MEKTTVYTNSAPNIVIEKAHANLSIKGWDRSEVTITAAPGDLKLDEGENEVRLSCRSECVVRIPHKANLQVENAYSALRVKYVQDQINIGTVHGHLYLRDVGQVNVETVNGNLSSKGVSGDFRSQRVNGNAYLRGIQGDCHIDVVNGNLDVRDVDGEVSSRTNGNVRLYLNTFGGTDYSVEAQGNIHCRIPHEAGVSLKLTSRARTIRLKLPDGSSLIQENEYQQVLGDGEASMTLSSGGSIFLSVQDTWDDMGPDDEFVSIPEEFGDQISEQIEAQIEEQMEMMNRHLNEQFEHLSQSFNKAGLSDDEMDRILEQAKIQSERANVRAQEKIRLAQEKMVRKMEVIRRRNEQRAQAAKRRGRGRSSWSAKISTEKVEPVETVSEEERLMILRMLEQKKITPEEADELLAAMEG